MTARGWGWHMQKRWRLRHPPMAHWFFGFVEMPSSERPRPFSESQWHVSSSLLPLSQPLPSLHLGRQCCCPSLTLSLSPHFVLLCDLPFLNHPCSPFLNHPHTSTCRRGSALQQGWPLEVQSCAQLAGPDLPPRCELVCSTATLKAGVITVIFS